tara:strand:+ start:51 stop:1535 length:1485 start_codon:yes stop_codon:yes gene_type:complete
MGIGKSLKKFVKKAAPIAAMVAPIAFPGMGAGLSSLIGAAGGALGGGGVKGALLGGIGGYAAHGFGQGVGGWQGMGNLLKQPGGIGQILSKGWGGIKQTPIAQGIGKFLTGTAQAGVPSNQGLVAGQPLPGPVSGAWGPQSQFQSPLRAKGFLGPSTGVGPWSDIAQKAVSGAVTGTGEIEGETTGSSILDSFVQGGGKTWGGLVDFAKNAFNQQNLPLTAGLLGGLAQLWENKTGEKPGQVSWGEGLDYYSPTRGSQVHGGVLTTPAAANGGRIGFANGGRQKYIPGEEDSFMHQFSPAYDDPLYAGDTGEQSLYRDLVKVFTGEITGTEAQAIMEAAEGDLGGRAIEMAKQEASYKPMANGGRMRFANGNEVDPEYEGWKQIYTKNPDLAMMTHPNAAEYLKRLEKEQEVDIKARGGIIGLANGGEPAYEMDLRGGGFIPVGAYERADDVPARVSKNEFVMTADAVRAAGGGSIEKGSQRMYDLMNSLEARV